MIKRIIIYSLTVTIFVNILAGCRSADAEDTDSGVEWTSVIQVDPPDTFYMTEIIDIPAPSDSLGGFNRDNIVLAGDTIYATAWIGSEQILSNEHSELTARTVTSRIFSIDINTVEATQLPNFVPSAPSQEISSRSEYVESNFIAAVHVDSDGFIWIFETVEVCIYDFPENLDLSDEDIDISYYRLPVQEFNYIRKLDKTGADLAEPIPIPAKNNSAPDQTLWVHVRALSVDISGNIYPAVDEGSQTGSVTVFDPDGNVRSELDIRYGIPTNGLILLPDGNAAVFYYTGNMESVLREIDAETGRLGRTIELPRTYTVPIRGNEEHPVICSDRVRLFSCNPETGEVTELLNLIESGIDLTDFAGISFSDDDRLMLVIGDYNSDYTGYEIQIVHITKTSGENLTEKTMLSLAVLHLSAELRQAILNFNNTSLTHHIHVIDYSIYDTGDFTGTLVAIDKLSLDLTVGNIPDMIVLRVDMPMHKYVSMGLLEDLYPYIDADSDLDRDSFTDGVLRATEINGGLYKLVSSFGMQTMIGNPSVVGDEPGWNMDEFTEVIRNNPQADIPLGDWVTREVFFSIMFFCNSDHFLNYESGTADFNNEKFIHFLESMMFIPLEIEGEPTYVADPGLIAAGRQIIDPYLFLGIMQYQAYRYFFGGDIVFKGYPVENRNGHLMNFGDSIAITVTCTDKAGAWEFIRSTVTEDFQRRDPFYGIPVNKVVFEEMLERAMVKPPFPDFYWGEHTVPWTELTKEEADRIREMISNPLNITASTDPNLYNIIEEETSKFFNGHISAEDAARIIQNRAAIFMSEQMG